LHCTVVFHHYDAKPHVGKRLVDEAQKERIKLVAQPLNNLTLGFLVTGVITPSLG